MKIAILTMFNGFNSTYSLVNVVAEQIRMILENSDNEVTLFISETCDLKGRNGVYLNKQLKYETIVNTIDNDVIHWVDYDENTELSENFFNEVEIIKNDMIHKLDSYDVCLMHDILYQGAHLLHNIAIREAQKNLPKLRFIAFTHSMPLDYEKLDYPFNQRFCEMPNTIFVYPTVSGLKALSEQYNVDINRCRVVYNSIPTVDNLHKSVKNLIYKTNFTDNDVLAVYPSRLTPSKSLDKVAMFCGSMKKANNIKVKVIFCDFASSDVNSTDYKKWVIQKGIEFGLDRDDIIFTSDFGYKKGFDRLAVLDLFKLSNLFVCPSFAESFGLTVLEAGFGGNFLILNESQPALKELGENLDCYFMKWNAKNFGYDTIEEYEPSEEDYYLENSKLVYELMCDNPVLNAKNTVIRKFSDKYIWHNQLKLLIENKIL